MNSDRSAKDVVDILTKKFSVNEVFAQHSKYSLRLPETSVSVIDESRISKTSKNLMFEGYNLKLTLDVDFADYRGKVSQAEQDNRIGKGIATILKEVEGDAIVLFDGETTIAQRTNGELILAEIEYEWLEQEFKKLGLRYQRKPLISPFLVPQVEEVQAA